MRAEVVLSRRGAERAQTLHPWIFRSDVVRADAEPGDLVRVTTDRRRHVGWAFWSSASQIALRMISTASRSPVESDAAWIRDRLSAALAYRASLGIEATAWRVVHGESDGLPATVVDRYADDSGTYCVVQTLSQAAERRLDALVAAIVEVVQPRGIMIRNDPKVRRLEGLEEYVGVASGEIPERVMVTEGGVRYAADLRAGQKTGLFLDQRENHEVAAACARGQVLDAFAYHGGFALPMAKRADHVTALDSSAAAVATTERNARVNGLTNIEVREVNVFDELREFDVSKRQFDTIVLDPPAFAKNKASVERACAGYKEINLRALRLLAPGGHLITCSCSYNVDAPLFLDILRAAAADAGVVATVVETRGQARDHPVLLNVPETSYLKCLVLRRAG
jgi:23S rRNA (cytosine1962-C5)-methyltransferase